MSDSNSNAKQQIEKLFKARRDIDLEIGNLSTRWGIARGRRPLYIVSPDKISMFYWIFLALCFIAGIIFTLRKGTLSSLGVALVVGSLFAGGAVVGQVWAFAFQEKNSLLEKALGNKRTQDLEDLGWRFWESRKGIDHLPDDKARKQLKAMLTSIYPDNDKAREQLQAMLTSIQQPTGEHMQQQSATTASDGNDRGRPPQDD